MRFAAFYPALAAFFAARAVVAAPAHTLESRVDYPQYETEEECHAAGWEVCRRYVVSPGVSLWTGYPGPAEPEAPKFPTQEECEAVYETCIGYKRADGHWEWRGVEIESDDDPEGVDYPQYETEEECHAAGWEVCRRYVVSPGVSLWTGYPGPAEPETPKFDTQEACEAVYETCLGYKRADGHWVWRGVPEYDDDEEERRV